MRVRFHLNHRLRYNSSGLINFFLIALGTKCGVFLLLVLLLSFIILTLSRKMLTKGQIYFKNTYFLKYVWPFFNIIHEKGKYP